MLTFKHIIANMVDQFDKELIALLEQDARQSSENLAKKLSLSPSTVRRRMSRLLEQGAIRIVAIPKPESIGLSLIAVIAFQLSHEKVITFTQTMRSRKEVKCLFLS